MKKTIIGLTTLAIMSPVFASGMIRTIVAPVPEANDTRAIVYTVETGSGKTNTINMMEHLQGVDSEKIALLEKDLPKGMSFDKKTKVITISEELAEGEHILPYEVCSDKGWELNRLEFVEESKPSSDPAIPPPPPPPSQPQPPRQPQPQPQPGRQDGQDSNFIS